MPAQEMPKYAPTSIVHTREFEGSPTLSKLRGKSNPQRIVEHNRAACTKSDTNAPKRVVEALLFSSPSSEIGTRGGFFGQNELNAKGAAKPTTGYKRSSNRTAEEESIPATSVRQFAKRLGRTR
jgi:hypothetical protein